MRARTQAPARRHCAAPDWPPPLPAPARRRHDRVRAGRRRAAVVLAAAAVVIAAFLAALGLVAGTRAAAQGEDLGHVSPAVFVVE